MKRIIALLGLIAALVVGGGAQLAPPAAAGGWVVVSLDAVPDLTPGDPVTIGFTVLRHGVTPESQERLTLVATASDGRIYTFNARQEGDVGHHVATIDLPTAGTYSWSLTGQFVDVELGTYEVSPAPGASWAWDVAQWGGLVTAVAAAAAAGVTALRSRRRTVAALPA